MLASLACQKEKNPISPEGPNSTTSAFTARNGSYFVYDIFEIDSNGGATPFGVPDTIFVVGDTILNGHRFVHLKDQLFNVGSVSAFLRDSSGYIVDTFGVVHWAPRNLPVAVPFRSSQLFAWHSFGFTNHSFPLPTGSINGSVVPASSQAAFELQNHYYFTNGNHFSVCDSVFVSKQLFVSGLGMVSSQLVWTGAHFSSCKYYERRLSYYSIQL